MARPLARARASAAGLLTTSLLAACSPAVLLGAVTPNAPGGEVSNVAYGPGPRHTLDIYAPASAGEAAPVVVFFYGGGWKSGDRSMYRFVGRALAACGILVMIPDYRVWPEAGFPGFLQDAAAAVAHARQLAPRHGGDPARLVLMGHSAGAYIAAMLALDPTWLAGAGLDMRAALAGVIGIAGPYDFLPLRDPILQQIFAPAGPDTQPINFARNAKVPFLLMSGTADVTVDPANSQRLAARLRMEGARAEVLSYPGLGHAAVLGAFATPLRFLGPVRDDACQFLGTPSGARSSVAGMNPAAPPDQNLAYRR